MIEKQNSTRPNFEDDKLSVVDHKLAVYLAAVASGAALVSEADAAVVSSSTIVPIGINEEVNIDFNNDGQVDFQIDHDRVNLNGNNLDYLQIDKNDINSAADPYPIDPFAVFPVPEGQGRNWDHGYLTQPEIPGDIGYYPAALLEGAEIAPNSNWDFQEGDNFAGSNRTIRANRLIDEDATQIDAADPSPPPDSIGQQLPSGAPAWLGLNGETRYLGLRIDLQDMGFSGNAFPSVNGPNDTDNDANYWYGWIGVRILNEADATGEVVGWGYETELGQSIMAGETAPALAGDYNGNGAVDAADYTIWRDHLGLMGGATAAQGDGNGDGNVTQADFEVWQNGFTSAGSGAAMGMAGAAAAVPEPSSLVMGLLAGVAMVGVFLYRRVFGR